MGRRSRPKISDFPHHIQDQIAAQLNKPVHRPSFSSADLEPHLGDESERKDVLQETSEVFNVHFRSIRKRLADPDNLSGKAVLDRLVDLGIFEDDTTAQIRSVTHSQRLLRPGEKEHTKILITPV